MQVVFGGTFDPVHNGHLRVLEQVLDQTGAGHALLVPAAAPNLRPAPVAPPAARLEMLETAVAGDPRLAVSDLELRRPGVSYTIDTLGALEELDPGPDRAILLGADAARSIPRWDRAAELLRRADFIVINRSGCPGVSLGELLALGFPAERTTVLAVSSPPVSAREVRRRVSAGERIDQLVPEAVRRIIERDGLYRKPAPRA
ncbi:MAG: nicotinate (nicotinamide) nucleotide adenylyltransferase [Candidatus Dormibacteraeota bacterium]|nr:nicotinate (nicotinamide) nucleotide adenylyltransferase [Candidatus Dormibacteraeota bacterium]